MFYLHFASCPFQDRESGLFDQVSSHSASGTINNSENPGATQDRLRFNGNDRLPGTVLLARERLLHRLSGLSLSENRLGLQRYFEILHFISYFLTSLLMFIFLTCEELS